MRFTYEKEAERGSPMPEGLELPDQLAYQFLRGLYRDLRSGTITKDQALEEKGKMTYRYLQAKGELQNFYDLGESWARHYKETEGAASAYAKDRTLERADDLYQAVCGTLPRGARA